MQNPIVKLTVLASVLGIGFLAVYQAQKSMSHPNADVDAKKVFEELADPGNPQTDSDAAPPDQSEPNFAEGSSANNAKKSADMFGSEPPQPDTASSPGIDFSATSPNDSTKPFEPHLASSQTTNSQPTTAKDAPSPSQNDPFATGNIDQKDPAAGDASFDPIAAESKKDLTPKGNQRKISDNSIQPAGFDAPSADAAGNADNAKAIDETKSPPKGGPQLFSLDSEPAPATPADAPEAAKDSPVTFPGDAEKEIQAVPRKGVRTAANTDQSDAFDPAASDPFAPSTSTKKADEKPVPLDDQKPLSLDDQAPPTNTKIEVESKTLDAPAPNDAPLQNDAPLKIEDQLKIDDAPGPAKDATSPQLVPEQDAFPSKVPAKALPKLDEPAIVKDQDPFGVEKALDSAETKPAAEPALPDPSASDPFKQNEKKSTVIDPEAQTRREPIDAPHDEKFSDPTPSLSLPDDSGRVKISPDEPAPLGDRVEQSEPVPAKSKQKTPAATESIPPAEEQASEPTVVLPRKKFKSPPKNPLPVIRPRSFKRGSSQPADDSAENSKVAPEEVGQDAPSSDEDPSAASRDIFKGDGTVEDNSPQGPQQPRLVLTKSAPPKAAIGQPLIYNILVRNAGDSPAHEVVVQDRIPRGTQLKGTIPQAELIDRRLVWKLGTLAPGAKQKISIRVIPTEEGTVGSVATVTFAAEIASKTVITSPKITVGMSAPERASVGENVTFRFKVSNRGNAQAANVVLRDILPEGLKHAAGKELEFAVGTLPAGESRDVDLILTAAEIGEMVNRAVVTTAEGVSVEAKAAITIEEAPLVLSRTGPKQRYSGREAQFTNTITNRGRAPVPGVTVVESVPPGLEFVEASDGGQYNPSKRTIAWRLQELPSGGTHDLHVKLMSKDAGKMTSSVVAFDQRGNKVEATSETTISGFATVSLDVSDVPGALEIGETVKLKIAVNNRGTTQATKVALRLTIPDELEIASIDGPAKYAQSGSHLEFAPIQAVDANGSATFDVALKARRSGDVRLGVQVEAEQMTKPVTREEAILILGEGQ